VGQGMLTYLSELTNIMGTDLILSAGVIFAAGLVRGFAGFALSAVVMASLVALFPPIDLIPICFILEGASSIAMFRGGAKQADMQVVWGLVVSSAIGVPIGLFATTTLDPELSKLVALAVILILTSLQLLRVSPRFIKTKSGLYMSGLTAGIVTGLASVGGLVVALYVLASKSDPRTMRASLVMFLALGMFTTVFYHLAFGILDKQAFIRGAVFTPIVLSGVFIGSSLFRPSLAGFYKTFCLVLLITLSLVGIARLF